MYKGEADWTLIGDIKNNPRMHIPIFGNGDIDSPQKALAYKESYGVDGIMIGRGFILCRMMRIEGFRCLRRSLLCR